MMTVSGLVFGETNVVASLVIGILVVLVTVALIVMHSLKLGGCLKSAAPASSHELQQVVLHQGVNDHEYDLENTDDDVALV